MPPPQQSPTPRSKRRSFSSHYLVFFSILSFRIVNALTVRTFFQPDEFFQALEPAWRMIFGEGWLTWEWRNQLRSIAHPLIFAGVYKFANSVCELLGVTDVTRAEVLAVAPKILQAIFATLGDYFTAKLAGKLFGGAVGWTSVGLSFLITFPGQLWLSIGSAFHYFCSTRTFSNSLETSITIIALYYWPWNAVTPFVKEKGGKSRKSSRSQIDRNELRLSLLLAAFACILRPTNVLIWACLGSFLIARSSPRDRLLLVIEAVSVGLTAVLLNAVVDHRYYDVWTFPPLKFLEFNVIQSLSIFYGSNPWHYYLSQGLPLLLASFLPLGLYALYLFFRAGSPSSTEGSEQGTAGFQLASTVTLVTMVYSLISHKEVRFIYPLLPVLHVLSAAALENLKWSKKTKERLILGMILANLPIVWYATQVHQRGVIDVVDWLRKTGIDAYEGQGWKSVGFLMPCHSTPWRSSVIGTGEMWALSCEPPIGLTSEEKSAYLDEADQFYASPKEFLAMHLPLPPKTKSKDSNPKKRTLEATTYQWPDKLVFFEALEPTLKEYLGADTRYEECRRFFNSHVHDDSRRKGDVVVWCLQA